MTNVKRPIHLHLRIPPPSGGLIEETKSAPLTPNGDLLPSQIMPNLFVGNLDQTNRETVNRLNISYILSLGLMPLISSSTSCSPTSPAKTSTSPSVNSTSAAAATAPAQAATQASSQFYYDNNNNLLPSHNSSKYFKFRIRSHDSTTLTPTTPTPLTPTRKLSTLVSNDTERDNFLVDENKGINNNKVFRTIHCKCINIADNNEQLLAKFFDEAHQFIDEARRRKSNVLVHCLAGISRSPTIAIAYLMRCNSLRLQDAYNFVKRCRPQIDPNLSFMGQLMIYEKSLEDNRDNKGNNSIPRLNKTSGNLNNINHHHQQHGYHHHKQNGKLSSST